MQNYAALLRGINVGDKLVDMSALRKIFVDMGAKGVETYMRSGNVVFDSEEIDATKLRSEIEKRLLKGLCFSVKVFVKSGLEMRRVVDMMPFDGLDKDRMHVTFLSAVPDGFSSAEIDSAKANGEEYALAGNQIYLYCPAGYGRTKLSNNFFEKKLKVDATTRNWRTVKAILKLMEDRGSSRRKAG